MMNSSLDITKNRLQELPKGEVSRRRILQFGLAGATMFGAVPLLAGCSSEAEPSVNPTRGGTLTVGAMTGTETIVPGFGGGSQSDEVRIFQLFDTLFEWDPDLKLVPRLAESAEPNADATLWTITMRDGVVWHDGKPLTAEDLLYTIKTWEDPEFNRGTAGLVGPFIDYPNVRVVGPLSVEVPLKRPLATLPDLLARFVCAIIQDGQSIEQLASNPIGTGPFKFESFTPGERSVFAANRDYWQEGKPYVDELVIDSSYTDENARLAALQSGAIDIAMAVPFTLAARIADLKGVSLLQSSSPNWQGFLMRVDSGDLSDVRIRQALRLIPDRDAFVETVFRGFATPSSDLLAPGAKYYADSFTREQDIDQAKSLLRAAGKSDLQVTLNTSAITAGMVESATLLKEQARAAGVDIRIHQSDPSTYYTAPGGYGTDSFRQTFYYPSSNASLSIIYPVTVTSQGQYNETGFMRPEYDALVYDAMGELDEGRAEEKWYEVQRIQFEEGGHLVPATMDVLDGVRSNVSGLKPSRAGWLGGNRLLEAHLS